MFWEGKKTVWEKELYTGSFKVRLSDRGLK